MIEGLPHEYNSFVMMICGKVDTPSIDDIEASILVQEAQFEKYRQDLVTPSTLVNLTQGQEDQDSQTHNSSHFSINRGGYLNHGGRGETPRCLIKENPN